MRFINRYENSCCFAVYSVVIGERYSVQGRFYTTRRGCIVGENWKENCHACGVYIFFLKL